jgi:hypothetical protein
MIAEFNGIDYDSLVRAVLESAFKRYGFNYVLNPGPQQAVRLDGVEVRSPSKRKADGGKKR